MRIIFLFVLMLCIFPLGNSYAADKRTVLVVHSQLGVPYDAFTSPLIDILRSSDPKITIKEIVLDNHERRINRYLSKPEYKDTDVAIAVGTIALRALRDQKVLKSDFPVVFGVVTDPIGEGVIEGFNIPSRNMFTGISYSIDIRDRIRDLRRVLPHAKKIGVIYSTMPQSVSFKRWIDKITFEPEFSDLEFIYRRVGMIKDTSGPSNMIKASERHIESIKNKVDVFLSPSDQMGVLPDFSQTIVKLTNKPVFGIGQKDVIAPMAAVASSYPRIEKSGRQVAEIVLKLLDGAKVSDFPPSRPSYDLIFNENTAKYFGLSRPSF